MELKELTLRGARVSKGYTQEQAAKLIGVTADTLRSYEKGTSFPNVPTIKKMEDVYGVPYSQLKFLPE